MLDEMPRSANFEVAEGTTVRNLGQRWGRRRGRHLTFVGDDEGMTRRRSGLFAPEIAGSIVGCETGAAVPAEVAPTAKDAGGYWDPGWRRAKRSCPRDDTVQGSRDPRGIQDIGEGTSGEKHARPGSAPSCTHSQCRHRLPVYLALLSLYPLPLLAFPRIRRDRRGPTRSAAVPQGRGTVQAQRVELPQQEVLDAQVEEEGRGKTEHKRQDC
ncbi:hypothetical protein DFH09DRAFT_1396065 [Mycena vulgaris]|nr:hypothetical protein DFH09DRAFT_1396065 [Mycena vulgaris]